MSERKKKSRQELRTRVTFFLPAGRTSEKEAVADLILYLKARRRSALPITGFTHTPLDTVWSGYWWSSQERKWIEDFIVYFTIDYLAVTGEGMNRALDGLQNAIQERYRRYGCEQEETWVISQRITRHL